VLITGITDYFQPGRTVDDLFRDCLGLIIDPLGVTSEKSDNARETSADEREAP
jgi:hypothetical protein